MPNTGDKCTQTGVFTSHCGKEWTVHMRTLNSEFPPCPHCHKSVHYTWTREL